MVDYKIISAPFSGRDTELCSRALAKGFARNEDPTMSTDKVFGRLNDLIILKNDTTIVILEYMYDDFDTRYLFIWTIYAFNGKMDLETTIAAVVAYATIYNCRYIELFTQRDGWDKLLASVGTITHKGTIHRKYI